MSRGTMSRRRCGLLGGALALLLCLLPATASAQLDFAPGGVTVETLDASGQPDTRAGAHPDRFLIDVQFSDGGAAHEDPKDLIIDLPDGLVGDANAVPVCPREVFAEYPWRSTTCDGTSQIGVSAEAGLVSVEAGPNEAAVFGAAPEGLFPQKMTMAPRADGSGLSIRVSDLIQPNPLDPLLPAPLTHLDIELWGVPADHQSGTPIPRLPLLSTPTRCDAGAPTVTVRTHTWQQPERWISQSGSSGHALTGCDRIPFDPGVSLALDDARADSPSGASVSISNPQNRDPDGRASSQLKEVSVALPDGVAISPGGAEGLAACGDAEFGLGSGRASSCPPSSRVGSVQMLLASGSRPLTGRIYLGSERPGDRFRLFIVAAGSGTEMKIAGSLRPDPVSGRLTTTLRELPQIASERMTLSFDGGPGALLATPLDCGAATASATFTPYSGTAPVARGASTAISGCAAPAPFAPRFSGGSLSDRAGAATEFTATLSRRDGEGLPERLQIAFPQGINTALGAVDPCAAAAAGRGDCAAASRIGSALAELGPGPDPAQLRGTAYLTGPYKDAPYGLALVFDSAIGPFDLGKMVVRGTIEVDSRSGQVSVQTNPLPTSIEGMPVRLQTLGLDLDRPGFVHNPTSCAPKQLGASLRSTAGARASASFPFRVRGCTGLRFRPAFALALRERGELHRGGRPGLRIASVVPRGDANIASAEIELPRLLRLDASELPALCARREAERDRCPRAARVGTASARTPLLGAPMQGEVYAVQPKGGGSPDIWAALAGSGLEVTLRGETEVRKGRVVTELTDLPDFTLSSFALRFGGGERGVFELRRSPCARRAGRPMAPLAVAGQNGATVESREPLRLPGNC